MIPPTGQVSAGRPSRLLRVVQRLSRGQRKWVKAGIDALVTFAALYTALALRLGTPAPPLGAGFLLLLQMIVCIRLVAFAWLGLYRSNLVATGTEALRQILLGIGISLLGVGLPMLLLPPPGFPRSVIIIEAGLSAALLLGVREVMVALLRSRLARTRRREPVLIYGAGNAGLQLAGMLARDEKHEYRPVCFVDDAPVKQGVRMYGLEVYDPSALDWIRERHGVQRALFAIPSLPGWRRQKLLKRLAAAGFEVSTVPSLIDLVSGRLELDEVGAVTADDLLGREAVPPDEGLLRTNTTSKVVAVTGAGGSIGSELCRQIAALEPRGLVLVENSEYALYRIGMELREQFPGLRLREVLGSVGDRARMATVFREEGVQTVYHAAAYKHVPLVEENPLPGLCNNVLGTLRTAEAAAECGVETFVLVSTDKAVRPSSVMGASKRAAELACLLVGSRAAAGSGRAAPRFVMVRFGNVLDSAGSVVPLFRRQIAQGGPVTVTHPEVTRYFMTIPEAAQLVVQAGSLGRGGEVFLLDMGKPVRIADLARRMIEMTPAASGQPVEIRYVGLRPGEKLYEELLTDEELSRPTSHPKVFRAREVAPAPAVIEAALDRLETLLQHQDAVRALDVLRGLVPDFRGGQSGLRAVADPGEASPPERAVAANEPAA
jgi:FlaA1/EpsC-like NDP-sugar epimerase